MDFQYLAALLKLPQLITQLEQTHNNQKSSSVTHEHVNVLHKLVYKLIHHSVWRNSGSQLWSASGASLEYDLYSVTGAVKSR